MQVICYLETGAGKTLIACMLVHYFAVNNKIGVQQLAKAICLVPTVLLVEQQGKALDAYVPGHARTGDHVGMYCGSQGIDAWNDEKWAQEISCASTLVQPSLHAHLSQIEGVGAV